MEKTKYNLHIFKFMEKKTNIKILKKFYILYLRMTPEFLNCINIFPLRVSFKL